MIPVEAWVFLPLSTGGVEVWEEVDGAPVVRAAAASPPAVGLALTVPFQRVRHARLLVELRGEGRTAAWRGTPDLTAQWGVFGADMGWRWGRSQGEAASAPAGVDFWWAAGGGARVAWMSALPWDPWGAWGLGATTGLGFGAQAGPVRPMLELRAGLDLLGEAVTGTLDTAVVDMGWTWTPLALNAAFRCGVAF